MIAFISTLLFFLAANVFAATSAPHPLDPLSKKELATTFTVLKTAGHVDDKTRFVFVSLREPDKVAVLKWQPGAPTVRETFVMIKQGARLLKP